MKKQYTPPKKTYRRGFQQSLAIASRDQLQIDPYKLRYERHIDKAPFGECGRVTRTAIDILRVEYDESFMNIGLDIRSLFKKQNW